MNAYSELFNTLAGRRLLVMKIMWAGLTASMLIYVGVAFMLSVDMSAGAPDRELVAAIYVLSAVIAVVSFVVPRMLVSDAKLAAQMGKAPDLQALASRQDGSGTRTVDQSLLAELGKLAPMEQRLFGLLGMAQVSLILRLALHESIVIFGLLLVFLGAGADTVVPFAAVGVILNVVAFPRLESLFERGMSCHRGEL